MIIKLLMFTPERYTTIIISARVSIYQTIYNNIITFFYLIIVIYFKFIFYNKKFIIFFLTLNEIVILVFLDILSKFIFKVLLLNKYLSLLK